MARLNQYTSVDSADEHYTPKWIFDELGIVFDLDVASPAGGSNVPCKHYFTQEQDGLTQEWYGNVFMNPPFSQTTVWARKFIAYGRGIAILPASAAHWAKELWETDAGIVLFTKTLRFDRPNGEKPKAISYQLWIVAYGDENKAAISKLGKMR